MYQPDQVRPEFGLDIGLDKSFFATANCFNQEKLVLTYQVRNLSDEGASPTTGRLTSDVSCVELHTADELAAADDAAIIGAIQTVAANTRAYVDR